jgi:hypothetical protein
MRSRHATWLHACQPLHIMQREVTRLGMVGQIIGLQLGSPCARGCHFVVAPMHPTRRDARQPRQHFNTHTHAPHTTQALGFAIIGGACVTKVPQILAISGSKSADGLSALSFELEAVSLLIMCAYGYLTQMPFNAYGEALVLGLQVRW